MTTKAEFDAYAAGAIATACGSDVLSTSAFYQVIKTMQSMGDEAFDALVESDPTVEKTGADKSVDAGISGQTSTTEDVITISGAELTAEQAANLDAAVTSASTSEAVAVDTPVSVAEPVVIETAANEPTLSDLPTTAWPDPVPAVPVAEPNDATAI